MAECGPNLKVETRWCPHCKQNLLLKTYKAHKRVYYDPAKHQWVTKTSSLVEGPSSDCEYYSESPPLLSDDDSIMDVSIMSPDSLSKIYT